MSIHVCKCEHNGRTEYHLRYPGMTQEEAQALADRINGGELVGADNPMRKNAKRYCWLRDKNSGYTYNDAYMHGVTARKNSEVSILSAAEVPDLLDAEIDARMARAAFGAA